MERLIQELEAWKKALLTGDSRYTWVVPKEIFTEFDEILSLAKSHPSQDMPLAAYDDEKKGRWFVTFWMGRKLGDI